MKKRLCDRSYSCDVCILDGIGEGRWMIRRCWDGDGSYAGPSTFLIDTESRLPTCNAQHPLYIVYSMHSFFIPFSVSFLIQFHIFIFWSRRVPHPARELLSPCPEGKLGKLDGGLSRIHNLNKVANKKPKPRYWWEADCRVSGGHSLHKLGGR